MGKYISIRSGASAIPEQSVAHITHDLIYQSGVYDILTSWIVSEHSPANMSVDVSTGRGYFKKTTMTYHGYSDAAENVLIASNNSGNPRIDAIVAYVDLAATPDSTASNVLKFTAVQGTPASSPVAPDDTAIQTGVGAGNPFVKLANVQVVNGASSIAADKLTDIRSPAYVSVLAGIFDTLIKQGLFAGVYYQVDRRSASGTVTLDCTSYNVFELTMTGNITLAAPSGMEDGQRIEIEAIQDGTGSRTLTWFSGITWPDGVAPTQTATASKGSTYIIKKTGTSTYKGYLAGENQ